MANFSSNAATTVAGKDGKVIQLYNPGANSPLKSAERAASVPIVDLRPNQPNPSYAKGADPRGTAFLKPVVFILDNSLDEVNSKFYVIGDPYGIFADKYPETLNPADSGTIDPEKFNASMATYFIDVAELNYRVVIGDLSQFDATFQQGRATIDGDYGYSEMSGTLVLGQQMTTQDPELMKVIWTNGDGPDVDKNFCLVLEVLPGTKVSLAIKAGTYVNK